MLFDINKLCLAFTKIVASKELDYYDNIVRNNTQDPLLY